MWDDIRSIIIENRTRQGMSQADLAIMIGKEQSYIHCVESGQIKISEDIVCELTSALNIDLRTELYLRYSRVFSNNICANIHCNDSKLDRCSNENVDNQTMIKVRERKTKKTSMLIRKTTKLALTEYARENNTSMNDVLENLAEAYIRANVNQEVFCQYTGIIFNPASNAGIKKGEKKTERFNLLLKESTKDGIEKIAESKGTSLNDIIHRLADSFLWEQYK